MKVETIPSDILHSFDRIPTEVFQDAETATRKMADVIISAINSHNEDRPFKLGLTTGRTPLSLYQELRERFIAGKVSFRNVEIFSIDEYYPSKPTDSQSRNRRLHDDILNVIDILPENTFWTVPLMSRTLTPTARPSTRRRGTWIFWS